MNAPGVLRRIGLIGDVHGENTGLAGALDFLQFQPNPDALLCTGHVPAKEGEGDSDACVRLLTDADVLTVRGNHDRRAMPEPDQSYFQYSGTKFYQDFARALPAYRTFEVSFGPALLCHGVGSNDMEGIFPHHDAAGIISALKVRGIYEQYRVLLCGHKHQRLVRTLGTITVINAGTLRRDNAPCFSVVDFERGDVQFFDVDPETLAITPAEKFRLLEL